MRIHKASVCTVFAPVLSIYGFAHLLLPGILRLAPLTASPTLSRRVPFAIRVCPRAFSLAALGALLQHIALNQASDPVCAPHPGSFPSDRAKINRPYGF
ncbi:hypothetical protein VTN00DRAFT_2016 [Thermoascus crustaceus]|uniref:uncharacterized protein n=1 Tax=Thermoascus crustaceus TaxID=5088 RepID=UPI0037423448